MDEELQSIQLDRPGSGKSAEELKKHTLDSNLDNKPVERALFLLTKGDDIQKLSVIQSLPHLLQVDSQATFTRIIPKIQQQLPASSCEFHIAASKIFTILMERKVPLNLLGTILQGTESRDPMVSNAWIDSLLHVIPTLNETQIKTEIIPLAVNKSHLNQPVLARIASCKILGKVALHPKLLSLDIKRDVLPVTQSLCQDCSYEVRAAMCVQLPSIAQGLGNNFIKATLLPSLVELASDENMKVRSSAVLATVLMLEFLTEEVKKNTIVPLLKQLAEKSLDLRDYTSSTIAKEIGKILEGLQSCLTVADSVWFLELFNSLSHRGVTSTLGDIINADATQDALCRQHCAYNLPAVASFVLTAIPNHTDILYSIFRYLAADPCYIVRRTLAASIHEIIKILGPENKTIRSDFVRLLRDDAEEVLQALVPHIGITLELFSACGALSKCIANNITVEIGRALVKCQLELMKGTNWRLLEQFLHQLECLPNFMPAEFIHQHYTPSILGIAVAGRARPVRSQAARTLLIFLRYNNKQTQRDWLQDNLISQLCYAKCCYTRHIYVQLCAHALNIFSNKYFKANFYLPLLHLTVDPVSNIRLCVVNLLPALKNILVMPEDKRLAQILDDTISKLEKQEQNRDVLENFKNKMKEMNAPSSPVGRQERIAEERKRIAEEEDITFGKPITRVKSVSVQEIKSNYKRPATVRSSVLQRSSSLTKNPRSASLPPKTTNLPGTLSSDMRFLEQHFYIDAGIVLPAEKLHDDVKISPQFEYKLSSIGDSVPNEKKGGFEINYAALSETELRLLRTSPLNITDDAKVSLKKITAEIKNSDVKVRSSESEWKRSKRHSSVFSVECVENQSRKLLNRRSLNISDLPNENSSRIPVSLKTLSKQKEKGNNKKHADGDSANAKSIAVNDNAHGTKLTKLSDIIDSNTSNKNDIPTKRRSESFFSNTQINALKLSDLSISHKRNNINKSKQSNLPVLIK